VTVPAASDGWWHGAVPNEYQKVVRDRAVAGGGELVTLTGRFLPAGVAVATVTVAVTLTRGRWVRHCGSDGPDCARRPPNWWRPR